MVSLSYLDTSEDKFSEGPNVRMREELEQDQALGFVEMLRETGSDSLDFVTCIRRQLQDTKPSEYVSDIVLSAVESG